MKHISYLSVIFILAVVKNSSEVSLEEDLTLTLYQKKILDEFRDNVSTRLTHSYMAQDIYLIRWLRAKNFDLKGAEKLLMENLKWRQDNRMDQILKEDWSYFEKEYPYIIQGCDKSGRPVISFNTGDWNIQKAVISGRSEQLKRYVDKYMEEFSSIIRASQSQGKNVTQYSEIYDLGNYNIIQQGCPLCIPIYVYLFQSFESHFPGETHRMTLINTPAIFHSLLEILKPLMSPISRNSLFVFGKDKREWKEFLLEECSADQLTRQFGGTKESGFEIEEFRSFEILPC